MKMQRAAIVSVALCGFLALATPAYAAIDMQLTSTTQQLGSGEWGAAPSTTSLGFGTQGVTQIYFTVANTGTLPLTGATYTVSASGLKTGTTLSLVACIGGVWIVSTNTCSSGVTQPIVTTTGNASSAAVTAGGMVPALVGTTVTVQALLSKNPARTTVGSVTVTVDRSQVRAATAINA
jgi:hypothetical protein